MTEEEERIQDALKDSAFLAGLQAGFGLELNGDQTSYDRFVAARRGYLAPIVEKQKNQKDATT